MIVLEVTDQVLAQARADAAAIQAAAKRRGGRSWGGETNPDNLMRNAVLGNVAELVAGDYFGLENDPTVDKLDAVDLGGVIEVRGRFNVPGRDMLPVRRVDKHLDLPFLLVRVAEDFKHAELVGWMLGREALQLGEQNGAAYWNETSKCFYIPEWHYHSLDSLWHWLWVGAPRHTWKG